LILNNFTTLLGHSIGRLFGSLFPPQPQFRGRQVVTLHNQRDFLFFRRHRYAFTSPTQAKLQEIGPRFTLKLRWLRKGLPAVTARDGHVLDGANGDGESDEEGYGAPGDAGADDDEDEDEDMERQAMEEMGQGKKTKGKEMTKVSRAEMGIPALDEEQEYEWKWTPKMGVNRRMFYL
jgi:ribosome production factor 1